MEDARNLLETSDPKLQLTKMKRVRAVCGVLDSSIHHLRIWIAAQDLRKLEAAHDGDSAAYAHILDVAYGRKGKLKWEIMTVSASCATLSRSL